MENLDKDRNFLTQGKVFTDDQIDAYIDLNIPRFIYKFEHTPHPISLKCIIVSKLSFKRLFKTASFSFIWILNTN